MVRHVSKDVIIDILYKTIEVQAQGINSFIISLGGMKVVGDDEKKKAPGGVFMAFLKKSPK